MKEFANSGWQEYMELNRFNPLRQPGDCLCASFILAARPALWQSYPDLSRQMQYIAHPETKPP
jgi:hypothetical protein